MNTHLRMDPNMDPDMEPERFRRIKDRSYVPRLVDLESEPGPEFLIAKVPGISLRNHGGPDGPDLEQSGIQTMYSLGRLNI